MENLTESLKLALEEVLDSRNRVDAEKHHDHHLWIESQIIKQRRCLANRDKIMQQVLGWGTIAMLASIGTAVYHFFFKGGVS